MGECFSTCDRVDLCDKFDPKLLGGAPDDHRSLWARLRRLLLIRLQRPRSEINQTADEMPFYLEGLSAASEDERVFISHFIFSLTCFCILKFHNSPSAKDLGTILIIFARLLPRNFTELL